MLPVSRMRELRTGRAGFAAALLALLPLSAAGQGSDCYAWAEDGPVRLDWVQTQDGYYTLRFFTPPGRRQNELRLNELSFSTFDIPFDDVSFVSRPEDAYQVTPVDLGDRTRFDYALTDPLDGPTYSSLAFILMARPPAGVAEREAVWHYDLDDLTTGENLRGTLDFVSIEALDCGDRGQRFCGQVTADCDDDGRPDVCQVAAGVGVDCDASGVLDSCEGVCVGDFDGNAAVDMDDLARVLANFGGGAAGDLTCDDVTDLRDLGLLLRNFGSCK